MSTSAPVGAHRDTLDVAGSQGPAAVQQPPLDHRRVADQFGALPHQGVHPAQGMLEVMVGHVVEDVVQQGPRGREGGGIQVSGMGGTHLGHGTILAARTRPGAPGIPRGNLRDTARACLN